MNFSEAITEAFNINFTVYSLYEDDPDNQGWYLSPANTRFTAADADGAKAQALDYLKNSAGVAVLSLWNDLGGVNGFSLITAVPAQ